MSDIKNCKTCKHGVNYGDSVEYIWCERLKRRKGVRKTDVCKYWEVNND